MGTNSHTQKSLLEMKFLPVFLGAVIAQESGPGDEDSRAKVLTPEYLQERIDKVEEKCALFMDKALTCVPPEEKKSKYNFRISKVLNDAKWHQEKGKNSEKSLDKLETEFSDINSDAATRGSEIPVKTLNRLEAVCKKFVDAFFEIPELAQCGKFGAWKKRANHLLNDMTAMKNICLKIRLDSQKNPY